MTATAVDCPKAAYDKRIGLYTVIRTQPVDDGYRFFMEGGLIDSIGLGYFPDVAPPHSTNPYRGRDITFKPFDGDRYLFVQRY
ncbi:hypothetical protein QM588_10690 [Rhodococcus sp. IEGM 1354]|uniref:hypothetical protein n=1 Tax=Rhodococcus sp. IEGM 1354 TaxID=3047088 RepID=UPI0024B76FB2|nr:hypothetical protein [Rhodococcus sp. IEGM 1354]MDI9930867.1 hypothetical protein [Rhodococcus sp. IEGM 1354]